MLGRTTLFALVLAVLSSCTRDFAVPAPPQTTGFFTGRAVEPIAGTDQAQAVSGAIISVLGTNLHAVSDGAGSFTVGPLPVGGYRILFTLRASSGAVRQRLLSNVQVQRGGATSTLGDVPLHQNAQVAGRALLNGQSRANAGVTVFVPGSDFVAATADTGQYLLRDLPEGTVRIAAFRTGFAGAATTDLDVQGGALTNAVDLVLLPEQPSPAPGSIAGKVFVLGAGNANVTVTAFRGSSTTPAASVATGADGGFSLAGLAPDLYKLHFDLAGYPPADIPNLLIASGIALTLNDPVVLSPFGASNVAVDAGTPTPDLDAGTPDAGGPAPDAGVIGAQCASDNDCASGRLCVGSRCIGCAADADCRPGFLCRGGDCVRPCAANSDCAAGLVCTAGVCGACVTASDCGDPTLVCLGGSCAHCRTGADCAAGRACLPTGCGVCTADSQCDSGNLCVLGVCKPGTCHDNTGCPPTQRCDPQTLSCTTCSADSQCSAGRICAAGVCAVGNCHATSDCPSGQACLGNLCGVCTAGSQCARGSNTNFVCDTGSCVAGNCVNALSDCTGANAGMACIGHVCTACSASSQCGTNMVCGAGNRCVSGNCAADVGCPTGKICSANVCAGCQKNADCGASGVVCVAGSCVPGQCSQQTDCTGGLICNASHNCVGCAASSDCTAAGIAGVCSAGKCVAGGNCSFDTFCPAGQLCVANRCTHCAVNADCGASNLVCVNTLCVPGNCAQQSDCAGGLVCDSTSHTCISCTAKTDCTVKAGLANTVCDTGKCVAGVCTAATVTADCLTTGSYNGSACVQNQCVSCANDAQCPTGDKCYGSPGVCQPGNCHVNTDCGQQICASNFCSPCGTPGAQSGCDAGALCDTTHKCVAGAKCVDPSGCTGGQICANYSCQPCQNDWSATVLAAQCGSSAPLCVSGQCVTGNCHGSPDCTGSLASSPPALTLPYCNPSSHTCAACTASAQCPTGYVCDASTGGKCVLGNCNSFDVSCATLGTAWSCVTNHCTQVNPGSGPLPGGGSNTTVAEATTQSGSQPSVLSGNLGLYYSYGQTGNTGQRQVALDPTNLHSVRWSKVLAATSTSNFAGLVIPAPGYPGGELFLASDFYKTYALAGSDGSLMWTWGQQGQGALGVVGSGANAALTLAFPVYNNGRYDAFLTHADFLGQRIVAMPNCYGPSAPAFGKYLVYYLCTSGLTAVDPVNNIVAFTMAYPGGVTSGLNGAPSVWRASKTATDETVYFAATPTNLTATYQYSVKVTDAVALSGGTLTPQTLAKGPAVQVDSSLYSPTLLDTNDLGGGQAPRVIYASSGSPQITVTDGIGTLLASVPSPFTSSMISLAADGSIIGFNNKTANNGLLTGVRITPNPTTPTAATITTLWTLPLSPAGTWQTFAFPTAVGTPGASLGNLLAWGVPGTVSTAPPQIWEMSPGASAASFLPPQPPSTPLSWPWFGGDPGAHRSVQGFDCASNTDCAPSKASCLLNRCVGVCQTGNDCGNGQGCVMGQCEACVADASCGTATPKCSSGVCYAAPATGACSTKADCASTQVCVQATCVAATQPIVSAQQSWSGYGGFSVGTDGTIYTTLTTSGLTMQAWDKTTLNGPTLSPLATWPAMSLAIGAYGVPLPTIVRLTGNAYDTLFLTGGLSTSIYAIPGTGAPATGGTNFVLHTAHDSSGTLSFTGGLAQGTSTVLDGTTVRPTLFSYEQNRIFAIDAQKATLGTSGTAGAGNLEAVWSATTGCPASGCVDNLGPVNLPLLVGSDGTIYHFRTNGEVQAWDPNGDRTAPPAGQTYAGKLLWTFTAPTPWTNNVGARPAIYKAAGHDVLYFCTNISSTLAMLNVSATGAAGYLQTTVPCGSSINVSIVVDPNGYALVAGGSVLTLMSPTGAIAAQIGFGQQFIDGTNVTLADDGIAYLSAYDPIANGQDLTAVQITPTHGLSLLWQVKGVAGDLLDQYSFPLLVPGTPAHLMADYSVTGYSGPRYWTSFSVGTSHGPMPGAWSMQGGDLQHRNSLKTQ